MKGTIEVTVTVEVEKVDQSATRAELQRILNDIILDTRHVGRYIVRPLKVKID